MDSVDSTARSLVRDATSLVAAIREQGYSPERELATLCCALGNLCVEQGWEEMLEMSVAMVSSKAFKLRKKELDHIQ